MKLYLIPCFVFANIALIANWLYADEEIRLSIAGVTLLDKSDVSMIVQITNLSKETIRYNPRVFVTIGGDKDAIPPRVIPGVYRAVVAVFPPGPQVDRSHDIAIVRHGWAGASQEGGNQPTVELKPGETAVSSVKFDASGLIGSDFVSTIPNGINVQVILKHWNATASALESIQTMYKLKPPQANTKQIGFLLLKDKNA
jgi:hypothetical protein